MEILTWDFRKKLSGRIFVKFCGDHGFLYQNMWNFALLSAIFILNPYRAKKITQVVSYVVFTQVRRHVHKQITKRRYAKKKPGRSVFKKLVLFTLGLGFTMPYSLGVLVWNFYQMFETVSIEFWAPNSSTRLAGGDCWRWLLPFQDMCLMKPFV